MIIGGFRATGKLAVSEKDIQISASISHGSSGFSRVYVSDGWFGRTNLIDGNAVRVFADSGETYYFYVTAVNKKGVESGKSNIISKFE